MEELLNKSKSLDDLSREASDSSDALTLLLSDLNRQISSVQGYIGYISKGLSDEGHENVSTQLQQCNYMLDTAKSYIKDSAGKFKTLSHALYNIRCIMDEEKSANRDSSKYTQENIKNTEEKRMKKIIYFDYDNTGNTYSINLNNATDLSIVANVDDGTNTTEKAIINVPGVKLITFNHTSPNHSGDTTMSIRFEQYLSLDISSLYVGATNLFNSTKSEVVYHDDKFYIEHVELTEHNDLILFLKKKDEEDPWM